MLSSVPATWRALRRPVRVSSHRPRIFQKRCPRNITGWLGKRYTSSRLICRPSKRASSTRPLLAPRSTAAILRVFIVLSLVQNPLTFLISSCILFLVQGAAGSQSWPSFSIRLEETEIEDSEISADTPPQRRHRH